MPLNLNGPDLWTRWWRPGQVVSWLLIQDQLSKPTWCTDLHVWIWNGPQTYILCITFSSGDSSDLMIPPSDAWETPGWWRHVSMRSSSGQQLEMSQLHTREIKCFLPQFPKWYWFSLSTVMKKIWNHNSINQTNTAGPHLLLLVNPLIINHDTGRYTELFKCRQ